MIYDCFMFFNELELLDIRLNILDDHVDKFVLVEATTTHAGDSKPLHFAENRGRFRQFEDRIIHVVLEDDPGFDDPWDRESFQRNGILRGLTECSASDLILISDVDEIPNPSALTKAPPTDSPVGFQQLFFNLYLNNLNRTVPWWTGTCLVSFEALERITPQEARRLARRSLRSGVPNGGWHFSYLGATEIIRDKIQAFAHQELNTDVFTREEHIETALETGQDLFGRKIEYVAVPLDDAFPRHILQRQDQYSHLIRPLANSSPSISSILSTGRRRRLAREAIRRLRVRVGSVLRRPGWNR